MNSSQPSLPSQQLSHLGVHEAPIRLLPPHRAFGPGRDRRFRLPQYHVRLRGIDTAFADQGEGEPLLFIHGLAGNVTHWVNVAPAFLSTHRVLVIDLPGHGESDVPAVWSIDDYVAHVVSFLDRLQLPKITVIGHSMGGMVAAALTLQHPSRVSRAVLVNPAGMQRLPRWVRLTGRALLRESLLAPLLPRIWKHGILGNVFFTKNAYTEAFIRNAEQTYIPERDIAGIARVMAGLGRDLTELEYASMLSTMTRPIYLIWGDQDRLVPASFLRRAAARLPNVVIEEVKRCGHMPIIEYPQRVVDFLNAALSS